EEVLSRVIGKEDFGDSGMQVIGQFNLGFIITRLDRREAQIHDDLFIVDQHAADEKYNFETLQQTTKIQCQSLIRPRPIELSAADEITAMDNLEILRANGFEVKVSQDVPVGKRLELVARPQSKGTVFDLTDLEELISLMQDKAPGQMVRCSKTRMMFASRACRKSIMIGKPLRGGQMTTVVRHMGTLDQPWSCPHGRPTMRHLTDLNEFAKRSKEETDWKAF
ncbi:MutL C terminal dimerization domain-containing protein, partial [Cantharellus anzutake]|uniref:MutL C terminal dimerization domain-containing protein n=1 Tax=Cantharellus anzutake TaxID=1750568 RepID=UPI0019074149